ncbi:hypothetical protein J2R96_001266 [Bradyrhizobium elkanii]|nr:hypothetical protein [Bradyrhizobium elkanii]
MPPSTSASCPRRKLTLPDGQAAMEALILVAESGGPVMLARIGVMRH